MKPNIPHASIWPTVTFDTNEIEGLEQAAAWVLSLLDQDNDPQPDIEIEPETLNVRSRLLREAERLVNNDRNTTYDDPTVDFDRIAGFWSSYLDKPISTHDVAALMALLKLARIQGNPRHEDSWIDLAGYAACGWDCVVEGV